MGWLAQDLRYGVRQLGRRRRISLVALLVLAVGVGANTAAFSLVRGLLLRPLPWPDSEAIVSVGRAPRERPGEPLLSNAELHRLWAEARSFEQLAAFAPGVVVRSDTLPPTTLQSAAVTPSLFPLLRVAPRIGRAFRAADAVAGAHRVALLSHRAWTNHFQADAAIVGAPVVLNDEPHTIAGVLPEGFDFPYPETQIWTPLVVPPSEAPAAGAVVVQGALAGIGRLRPDVPPARAAVEVRTILERPGPDRPAALARTLETRVIRLREERGRQFRPALLALTAATGLLLALASANVAGLLLAHGVVRQRELAIRRACGAARGRVVRQLLVESALLGAGGGALGLAAAAGILRAAPAVVPGGVPGLAEAELDGAVFAFAAGLSLVTGLLCGAAPALLWSRDDLAGALDESAAGGGFGRLRANRAQAALAVAQVALATVVLIGAGLLLRSFVALVSLDPGFDPAQVVTAQVQAPALNRVFNRVGGSIDPADVESIRAATGRSAALLAERLERLRALPGVRAAALASTPPLSRSGSMRLVGIPGRLDDPDPRRRLRGGIRRVSPGYADAVQLRLLAGRFFTDRDRAGGPPVAVVSASFARAAFAGEPAVGRRLALQSLPFPLPGGAAAGGDDPLEVIGVVADVTPPLGSASFGPDTDGDIYLSLLQPAADPLSFYNEPIVVVRTRGDPAAVVPFLHEALADIHPEAPVRTRVLATTLALRAAQPRFYAICAGALGGVALVLAALGLYGVLAFVVAQRRREIGIRMALGAERGAILRMILGQGAVLAGGGALLGVAAAAAASRIIESLLFGVRPADPATFAAVAALVVAVALAACWLPARAATRVNPLDALREG